MKIHLLSGFLGSGKTTAIQSAASLLASEKTKVAVITNDQGSRLVDADLFQSMNIPGRQVINGCFCCNYDELDSCIGALQEAHGSEVVFAESVGSCTDIVATVLKPLLAYRSGFIVTLSVFADARLLLLFFRDEKKLFVEDVEYIFLKQLEEASVIIINKADLLDAAELQQLRPLMEARYRNKTILYQNSLNGADVRNWLDVLDRQAPGNILPSLDIDYQRYGTGEALLAWFDQELQIVHTGNNAAAAAAFLMRAILKKINQMQLVIGHLKFLVNGTQKISFTATSSHEDISYTGTGEAAEAALLINARIQTDPETLSAIISDAVGQTETVMGARIRSKHVASFQPGFPTPTHRMAGQ